MPILFERRAGARGREPARSLRISRGWLTPAIAALLWCRLAWAGDATRLESTVPAGAIPALQSMLDAGEFTSAEGGASRLIELTRPLSRADSLVVLDASAILVQARLRPGAPVDSLLVKQAQTWIRFCEILLGAKAPELARAHQYAGVIARRRGDEKAARVHFEAAVQVSEAGMGPDHPETVRANVNLAKSLFNLGDFSRSRQLLERALGTQERQIPPDEVSIAATIVNLNEARSAQGDTTGVLSGYRRVVHTYETLGSSGRDRLADALHRKGQWLWQHHRLDEAGLVLDRAVELRTLDAPGTAALAASLLVRARIHLAAGQADSAGACAERAAGLYDGLPEPERFRSAACLNAEGDADRRASRFANAEADYLRARDLLRGPPVRDPGEYVTSLRSLSSLLLDRSRGGEALAYAREALRYCERQWGPEHRKTASARLVFAAGLRAVQQPDSASGQIDQALADLSRDAGQRDPALAEALLARAAVAREQGNVSLARSEAERALRLREEAFGPEDESLSECLHELGIAQRRLGDEEGARVSLQRALTIATRAGSDRLEVAALLGSIAMLERARGDAGAAEVHFRSALSILDRIGLTENPQYALVLRNLASLENAGGRFAEAEEHYQAALQLLERTAPGNPDVAATLVGLGNARKARGETSAALGCYRRAIRIHRESMGPDAAALALDYYNLAVLLMESEKLSAAMDTAAVAEALSLRFFRLIVRGVSEREALHYSAQRVRGTDIVLTCAGRGDAPRDRRPVWDLVIRSRMVVLEEIAERRRVRSSAIDPTIARLDSALTSASNRLAHLAVQGRMKRSPEEYQELLRRTRDARETAERMLAERSEPFRLRQARASAGYADVAAALPEGSALIAWVLYDRLERPAATSASVIEPADTSRTAYAAFVLFGPGSEPRFVPLGGAGRIDALIAAWHREAGGGPRSRSEDAARTAYQETGRALRRAVWDPVMDSLKNADHLYLVPDGGLVLVNFDALPDDAEGYLLESAPPLHLLSAERELIAESDPPADGDGLLSAAAPDYRRAPEAAPPLRASERGQEGLPCAQFRRLWFDSLPGARVEGREVARLWQKHGRKLDASKSGRKHPEFTELIDAEATERAFKRLAPGHNILHIATHGFFLGADCAGRRANPSGPAPDELNLDGLIAENPLLLSGLAFAGANQRAGAQSSDDDGILTAEEIASMDLSSVDCVVLSACQTGLGLLESGEGVFGLRRAFQVAGAHSLVMTLWSVDDKATTEWMESMFEHRLRRGKTVTEAVRAASLEILRRRRDLRMTTHPYYWGAFVTTGDPR